MRIPILWRAVLRLSLFVLLFVGSFASLVFAQQPPMPHSNPWDKSGDKPKIWLEITYGAHLPAGILAQRFGFTTSVGGDVVRRVPSRWFYGVSGYYFFGYDLREDPLANYRTAQGSILDQDREIGIMSADERGFYVGGIVGKIIPFIPSLPNAGIRVSLSGGYLQHFIRLKDDNARIPLLQGDYAKGFDRLTDGVALTEFVGFHYASPRGFFSAYIGTEFTQGFTHSVRAYQYDLGPTRDETTRLDLLNGLRIGWTLEIGQKKKASEVYY